MIRFLAGVIVGALGAVYVLGVYLMSSTETTGDGRVTFNWVEPVTPV